MSITYREILPDELKPTRGYLYFMDKGHPLATTVGVVSYHRHIASLKEGRWLTSEEIVHHIDEDKSNNSPENLQVLTEVEHNRLHKAYLYNIYCKQCNKLFKPRSSTNEFCSIECLTVYRTQLVGITKEELELLIWTLPFTQVGLKLGCSDNGVRKWAKRLGCLMPPSRFHVKFLNEEVKLKLYYSALKSTETDK
jgi:hypothetical protein